MSEPKRLADYLRTTLAGVAEIEKEFYAGNSNLIAEGEERIELGINNPLPCEISELAVRFYKEQGINAEATSWESVFVRNTEGRIDRFVTITMSPERNQAVISVTIM